MTTHTTEEVLAKAYTADALLVAAKNDYLPPEVRDMLTAYAERLKADESAVPFGYVSRDMTPFRSATPSWMFTHFKVEPHGCIEAMPLFTHPASPETSERAGVDAGPGEALRTLESWVLAGGALHGDDVPRFRALADKIASQAEPVQAAKVEYQERWLKADHGYPCDWYEISRDAYANELENPTKGCEVRIAPTAEPVAQVDFPFRDKEGWDHHPDKKDTATAISSLARIEKDRHSYPRRDDDQWKTDFATVRGALLPDVKKIVERFLCWKLPENFAPDAGISFIKPSNPAWWPVGTNLFTAVQAEQMIRHLLQAAPAPDAEGR